MANPTYASVTVVDYNASPPPDDGTAVAANVIKWADVKTKLTDPIKTALDSVNTTVDASIDAIRQYFSQYETKSAAFSVSATADNGKLYGVSAATTVTLPSAATAGSTFRVGILKTDAAGTTVTIAVNGSDQINGVNANITIIVRYGLIVLISDGTNWFVVGGHAFPDGTAAAPGFFFTTDPDTGIFRIGANNLGIATGGVEAVDISSAGEVTMPQQPAFLARKSVNQANATGAGTAVTITFGTEIYDQGNDFDGTTFTAPVTARYRASTDLFIEELAAAMTSGSISLVTSNRNYVLSRCNVGAIRDNSNIAVLAGGSAVDMDAADTATVQLAVSNGAGDTADINADATTNHFSMELVA